MATPRRKTVPAVAPAAPNPYAWWRSRRRDPVRVACPQCRETFLTRGPDQKQKVYCSDRCRTAASRERRSTRRLRADLPIDVIALIEREVARRRAAGQSAKIATKQRITAEALAVGLAALAPESKPG